MVEMACSTRQLSMRRGMRRIFGLQSNGGDAMPMSIQHIESLLRTSPVHRPYAEFDDGMDCIRVRFRDCSVTEERISEHFTVLYDNHPKHNQSQLAGFNIKGVHGLGLSLKMTQNVADIIDMVVGVIPPEEVEQLKRRNIIDNPVFVETEIMLEAIPG